MSQSVCVKVPGTTANIGPGFDCLGIALQVFNWVTVSKCENAQNDGMIAGAAAAYFKKAGVGDFGFDWKIEGDVPRSRGMGSSVTVRLGILHGLNVLAGKKLSPHELFEICSELEGHPDNAAPAAYGGFTIARANAPLQRYVVDAGLSFVLLIPDFEVATPDARKALPQTVSLHDAVVSASNAAAIAGAFASGDYEKLRGAFVDKLHQPYREPLVPFLTKTIEAGVGAGALGGWLSGSGSTIACITLQNAEAVAAAMLAASDSPRARTIITKADNAGVKIEG